MTKPKKLTLGTAVFGLFITLAGSILLSQRSTLLQDIGGPLHGGGQLVMLTGLSGFLWLNIVERIQRRQGVDSRMPRPGEWMVLGAQITSVILMGLGVLMLGMGAAQFFAAIIGRGWGVGFYVGLASGLVVLASGLALWLIAHIAQRVDLLFERSVTDDSSRDL